MPLFVIAGKANCPYFVHAIQIANYLSDHLPDIVINKREFLGEEWTEFLIDINQTNGWSITKSPVIWKEVGFAGSRPHLIGGLSEFWEYIDDYYGTKTFLERKAVAELCSQNLKAFKERNLINAKERLKSSVVGIYGLNNNLAQMLLPELFKVPDLFLKNMVTIKIYDSESLRDFDTEEEIRSIMQTYEEELQTYVKFELLFCTTISFFIENTDFILITEDYSQRDSENRETWLKRCSGDMYELANEINDTGGEFLKLICCHLGPVCFTATTITKYVKEKFRSSVVAVTAHEGLKALNSVSKMTEIPISHLASPPVWGFVGLDQFVDVQGIIVIQDIIRPYKRAVKDIRDSSLPQKKVRKELRMLSCIVNQKNFENDMVTRCNMYNKLGIKPVLPLLRATLHLLELWSAPKKAADVVISLGIYSEGSSGIPQKIVFSQPVTLNDKNSWVPFDKLPILDQSYGQIQKCKSFTADLIEMIRDYF
ncbi:putative malate dehydrogenase 1B [Coccinella septempunctata]|uniref:putative malate dehydrogenase 1B n=1 Tax=Coccinella septempunctata TaxID=41139 RepID=UPI001D093F76|nr:putative malate dehydrogenase 1B [Coccinella septempunctata]